MEKKLLKEKKRLRRKSLLLKSNAVEAGNGPIHAENKKDSEKKKSSPWILLVEPPQWLRKRRKTGKASRNSTTETYNQKGECAEQKVLSQS